MRHSRERKAETHTAIVEQAARLFRERGIAETSVGGVMAEAGLTHGGFYRHFPDKDALVAATIRAIFDDITEAVNGRAAAVGAQQATQEYFVRYLCDEHLQNPGEGCPVPTLGCEIARGPEALKAEFASSFNQSLDALARGLPGADAERRAAATRDLAMRIGAVVLARACDAATAKAVVQACRPEPTPPPLATAPPPPAPTP